MDNRVWDFLLVNKILNFSCNQRQISVDSRCVFLFSSVEAPRLVYVVIVEICTQKLIACCIRDEDKNKSSLKKTEMQRYLKYTCFTGLIC